MSLLRTKKARATLGWALGLGAAVFCTAVLGGWKAAAAVSSVVAIYAAVLLLSVRFFRWVEAGDDR